jgi:hypothetical protein
MDISTVISATGTFIKFAGEVIADLKRRDIATIDAELLNLKKNELKVQLEQCMSKLEVAVKQDKAWTEQHLISLGLSNTTIRDGRFRAIERDASNEVEKATREYNRAMEEIALMECKLHELAKPWWKKLLGSIGQR